MAIAFGSAGTRLLSGTGTTSWDVAYPSPVNANDLLVMFVSTNGGTITTPPSGWTEIVTIGAELSNPKGGLYIKVASGGESGTVNFGSTSSNGCAQIFSYTGVDTTTPLDGTPTTVFNTTSGTDIVLPSITTSGPTRLVYVGSANSSTNTLSSVTGSERTDFGATGGTGAKAGALYDEAATASGATGTRTIVISASRSNWGAMLALREGATNINIDVPSVAVTVDAPVPDVAVGVALDIPSVAVTVQALDPTVDTGTGGGGGIAVQGTPAVTESTASGTTFDANYPTGIQANELLLAFLTYNDDIPPTAVPSGWTQAETFDAGASLVGGCYYKVATGSESGTVTFTSASTATSWSAHIIRLSGVDTTTPLDTTTVKAVSGSALTITKPTQTTVTNNAWVVAGVCIASVSSRDISDEAGWTAISNTTGIGRRCRVFYQAYPTAGATGTTVFDGTGATNLEMAVSAVALRPSSSSAVNASVPVTNVTLTAPTPDIAVGVVLDAPVTNVTVSAPAPDVAVGVNVDIPSVAVSASAPAPSVSVGINIDVPVTNITTTALAPDVAVGVSLDVPVTAVTVSGPTPSVSAGVNLDMPVTSITVQAYPPDVSNGSSVDLAMPSSNVSVTGYAPDIAMGVNLAVPVTVVTVTAYAPSVTVGVVLDIPSVAVAVQAHDPDVQATADVNIDVPVIGIEVLAYPPTFSNTLNIAVPPMTVTVDAWPPTVETQPVRINVPLMEVTLNAYAPEVSLFNVSEGRDLSFDIKAVPIRPTTLAHQERNHRFTIYVTAGEKELVGAELTEVRGQDISICTYQIALGTSRTPGTWVTPDVNEAGATVAQRTLKILVSNLNASPGYYFVWIKVIDVTEVPLIRVPGIFRVR